MTKAVAVEDLTVTQAYIKGVYDLLSVMDGQLEDMSLEGGSIVDGYEYEDEELETPISERDKETAGAVAEAVDDLREAVSEALATIAELTQAQEVTS